MAAKRSQNVFSHMNLNKLLWHDYPQNYKNETLFTAEVNAWIPVAYLFFQFRFFGPLALLALILCPPAAFGNFQFAFKCLTLIDSDGIIWQSDNAQPGLLQSSFCVLSHSKLLLQLAVAPFPGNLPNWSAGEHFIAWTCQWGCRFEGNWTDNFTANLCRYDTTIDSTDLYIWFRSFRRDIGCFAVKLKFSFSFYCVVKFSLQSLFIGSWVFLLAALICPWQSSDHWRDVAKYWVCTCRSRTWLSGRIGLLPVDAPWNIF